MTTNQIVDALAIAARNDYELQAFNVTVGYYHVNDKGNEDPAKQLTPSMLLENVPYGTKIDNTYVDAVQGAIQKNIAPYIYHSVAGITVPEGDNIVYLYYRTKTTPPPTPILYSVIYDLNGGTGVTPTESDKEAGVTFTVATDEGFEREGYIFLGWICDFDNAKYDGGENFTMPAQNVKFTAMWEEDTDIDDPTPPLGPDDPEEPIEDPDTPTGPATGDSANVWLYVGLLVLAVILGTGAILLRRRMQRNSK